MRVTIERLGHHGDGVADGQVFVPRTLPGERVEGFVEGARMEAPRILSPSPMRIKPPCPHYRACGGCAVQHARDSFVTGWKEDIIRQALAAQGLESRFRPPLTSPLYSRRRASFAGRRLKSGALVGFHARASDVVTAVPKCLILHPDLTAALPILEDLTRRAGTRKGELTLAITRSDTGLDLAVTGGAPLTDTQRADLGQWAGQSGLARFAWDAEVIAQAHPPRHRLGRAQVTPPPGAFLQATPQGEAALQAAVMEISEGARKVVDLFAGCGTFALKLAESAEVHAVEGAPGMLAALEQGWRQAVGLKRVSVEPRDLFRRPMLTEELSRYDCAVIDPPRAGAEAQCRELAASRVPVLAAISCNPVTFARDAKLLIAGGYRLDWVQLIDQFRYSPHVELAARFVR